MSWGLGKIFWSVGEARVMFCCQCNRMTDEMPTTTICGFNSTNRLLMDTTLWMPNLVHFIWLHGVWILLGQCWSGLGYVLLHKTSYTSFLRLIRRWQYLSFAGRLYLNLALKFQPFSTVYEKNINPDGLVSYTKSVALALALWYLLEKRCLKKIILESQSFLLCFQIGK